MDNFVIDSQDLSLYDIRLYSTSIKEAQKHKPCVK